MYEQFPTAVGDPYGEWKGGAFVPEQRRFTPTPQWQEPKPWHLLGPFSDDHDIAQMDLAHYVAPAKPRSIGPEIYLTEDVRGSAQTWHYEGVFAAASAPTIPTSGPTLVGTDYAW